MSTAPRATQTPQPRRAAPCRQPRSDPRARRAGEQPQGRQRRDPEAPADGVHRRLRLGQELAGVRHHRRGVAADDQRDLQRLRAGLHADAGPAGRRRPGRADDGDHHRPGADGGQRPLHGRHRHRRQRDAADPVQPARAAAYRFAAGVLVQCRLDQRGRRGHHRARRADRQGAPQLHHHRRHVPALRGPRLRHRHRPDRAVRRQQVPRPRARSPSPATAWTAGSAGSSAAAASSTWTSRSASTPSGSCRTCSTRSRPRSRSRASTSPTRG